MAKSVSLRPITIDDTDLIVRWRNSEDVRKNFIYQEEFTCESHLQWLEKYVDTGKVVQFIIENEDGKPIGSTYLRDIDTHHNKAEFGIFIGEKLSRGKGLGFRATTLTLCYAWKELNLHRVYLRVLSDNTSAVKAYEKAGFIHEGLLKDDVFLRGQYRDVVWMAVINPEYQEK